MSVSDYFVLGGLVIAIVGVVIGLRRRKKAGKGGCSHGCGGCAHRDQCGDKPE